MEHFIEERSNPLKYLADHSRTDKDREGGHSYFDTYNNLLHSRRYSAKNVLEIGIGPANTPNGGSIKLWNDYFVNATIHALDIIKYDDVWDELKKHERIKLHCETDAYQQSVADKFSEIDVIIDDGPHTLDSMIKCIQLYSNKLTHNGIMIIEDVQYIEWLDVLRNIVPDNLKHYIKTYDLRYIKGRSDDIVFVIDKLNNDSN